MFSFVQRASKQASLIFERWIFDFMIAFSFFNLLIAFIMGGGTGWGNRDGTACSPASKQSNPSTAQLAANQTLGHM